MKVADVSSGTDSAAHWETGWKGVRFCRGLANDALNKSTECLRVDAAADHLAVQQGIECILGAKLVIK